MVSQRLPIKRNSPTNCKDLTSNMMEGQVSGVLKPLRVDKNIIRQRSDKKHIGHTIIGHSINDTIDHSNSYSKDSNERRKGYRIFKGSTLQ